MELIYDRLNKIEEKLNEIIQKQDDFELRLESLEAFIYKKWIIN